MGPSSSNKGVLTHIAENDKKLANIVVWLVSFMVSLSGGFVLGWWRSEYEAEYRELWMVPFGLILLVTPAIVWFSLVFSDVSPPNNSSPTDNRSSPDPENVHDRAIK